MTAIDVGTVLAEGLAAHQAGRLTEADTQYRRVLSAQPGQPDALHLRGVVALQSGRLADAVVSVRQAVAVAPAQASFWNTLGVAERASGQLEEARRSFARAVELVPAYVEGWANLIATCEMLGDLPAEAAALERLTALQPTLARAWGRRGVLAYQMGQIEVACDYFGQAAEVAPDDPEAWSNLGVAQLRLSRLDQAEASQRRALALRPDFVDAMNNLASVLLLRSRWDEAAALLEQVIQRTPTDPNGWINLGHARKGQDRFEEARAAYQQVLALAPDFAVAMVGLGDALAGLGDLHQAIACYEQASLRIPNDALLYEHLGVALQTLGNLDEAIAAYRRCLALNPDQARVHSGLIFALDLLEGAGDEAWEARQEWNRRFGRRGERPDGHSNRPDPDRPLRVGYVSADFRFHSAGFLALPIVREHDRARVTVVCYSGVTRPDPITERFRARADVWHDVADLSDDALEALIRADEIDVLVDLSGHTAGNRLQVFAREPAPVQITAWGYATGTGLDAMHYFLADPVVVPPEAHRFYSEDVVSLPSLICYEPPDGLPPVMPPPSLARGQITFGVFNRLEKATPAIREVWAHVLASVPDARLIVKTGGKDDQARQQLRDDLAAHGIDPARIELRGPTLHREHLAAHNDIDILLDTFPHGGGVTSMEALLMGVPVVTLLGERVAGRLAASFLTTLGLEDLIATTPDEYVVTAVRLAGDHDRLATERATLRERLLASPLADASRYTRAVEDTYQTLWRRWCTAQTSRSASPSFTPPEGPLPNPSPMRGRGAKDERRSPLQCTLGHEQILPRSTAHGAVGIEGAHGGMDGGQGEGAGTPTLTPGW